MEGSTQTCQNACCPRRSIPAARTSSSILMNIDAIVAATGYSHQWPKWFEELKGTVLQTDDQNDYLINEDFTAVRCDGGKPECFNCQKRADPLAGPCSYDAAPRRRGKDRNPGSRKFAPYEVKKTRTTRSRVEEEEKRKKAEAREAAKRQQQQLNTFNGHSSLSPDFPPDPAYPSPSWQVQ